MSSSNDSPPVEFHLPLKPKDYHLLAALCTGPLHGYGLVKALEEQTDGLISLAPGNLYRVVRRLERDGLVEAAPDAERPEVEPAHEREEQRIYYRVTPLGRRVVAAETERMRALVRQADSLGLSARSGSG